MVHTTDKKEHIKKFIHDQLEKNKGINFFHQNTKNEFVISDQIIEGQELLKSLNEEEESEIIEFLTSKALSEFAKINQYYSFSRQSILELKIIYTQLASDIKKADFQNNTILRKIAHTHYERLKSWIASSNPYSVQLYSNEKNKIDPVPCYEYNAALQVEILGLDITEILQPVLDIGCGTEGRLVHFLRSKNIEAYGIDRFVEPNQYLSQCDWMDYEFGNNQWGTIISHLGFSNHFNHHHLRTDGDFLNYARKYMTILYGLKKGGMFVYAPDLPFIEQYLDNEKFILKKFRVGVDQISTTQINRID